MTPPPAPRSLQRLSVGWTPGDLPADPRVVAYLRAGHILVVARCLAQDELDPTHGDCVPIGTATDGTWTWPLSAQYYVAEHGVGVPPEFVEHAAAQKFEMPPPGRTGGRGRVRWVLRLGAACRARAAGGASALVALLVTVPAWEAVTAQKGLCDARHHP